MTYSNGKYFQSNWAFNVSEFTTHYQANTCHLSKPIIFLQDCPHENNLWYSTICFHQVFIREAHSAPYIPVTLAGFPLIFHLVKSHQKVIPQPQHKFHQLRDIRNDLSYKNTVQRIGTIQEASQSVYSYNCEVQLENEHRNPIINRVYASTTVNDCTKYEHDPLNIVGCKVVMKAGQADGQMDRQRRAWQYPKSWMGWG